MGCSYEGYSSAYIAINIPPELDLLHLRAYFIEHAATWEHADPTYDELFPGVGRATEG